MVFENKTVLITGGTGSMGQTLVRRILSGSSGTPAKVIVLSRDEAKQHDMRLSYLRREYATDEVIYENFRKMLEFRIGDVRSYPDVCGAIRDADIVVNAAALKQVPVCEYFPTQAVLTNCMGAANIVRAIQEQKSQVDTVVGISTDKACKPVNVMGMTKAVQERIITSANILSPDTRFISVRYGNVLASRGSVIPLFHDQISTGGPVTLTDRRMTRFLLSLEDAVSLVIDAIRTARPGETYVPRAPSATVENVARALIGDREIDVQVTGIRPGEKLHEIMISEEEINHCGEREGHYVIRPMLPELRSDSTPATANLTEEYSSQHDNLDLDATTALLERHGLLLDHAGTVRRGEIYR
jgi:FlaA1/EpsC-like NDP-sugar epimerase